MDLLEGIMGQMDGKKSSQRPTIQPRPATTFRGTPGSAGTNVWGQKRQAASSSSSTPRPSFPSREFKKEEPGTPTPSGSTAPLPSGRIPKRGPKSEVREQEPAAKRKPTDDKDVSFKPGSEVPVQLNMFRVKISSMDKKIQRIMFKVFLKQKDGKEFEINDGAHAFQGDVNRQIRRHASFVMFGNWFRKNLQFFNNARGPEVAAYDCADTFYVGSSFFSGDMEEHQCEMKEEDFSPDDWHVVAKLSRRKSPVFRVLVKVIGGVLTQGEEALSEKNRPELTRIVETVTNQVLHNGKFLLYASGVYPLDLASVSQPDKVTEIRAGFSKTIKIVEVNGAPEARLTLDNALSAFFKPTSLLEFCAQKYAQLTGASENSWNGRGGRGGGRGGGGYGGHRGGHGHQGNNSDQLIDTFVDRLSNKQITDNVLRDIERSMRGLVVEAKHLKKIGVNRTITAHGFHNSSARELEFVWGQDEAAQTISVEDYFAKHHTVRLRHPHLPLVMSGKRKGTEFFPLELLQIMPGQRLKGNQITVAIQSQMTGNNSSLPMQHVQLHQSIIRDSLKLTGHNQFMKAFGISMESDIRPITTTAKILVPPLIRLNQQNFQPQAEQPRINSHAKFVKPATVYTIAIANTDNGFDRNIGKFKEVIVKHCRDQGIRIEQHPDKWDYQLFHPTDTKVVGAFMEKCLRNKVTILLGICNEKRPDFHDVLKYYEEKIGMVTMQMCSETAQRLTNDGGNRQMVDNIMRKFNLKCGGTNFFIDVAQSIHGRTVCQNPDGMRKKLFANTQFVGLEMSHTGSRTQFDIQNSLYEGDPTVVGVSYSLSSSTQLGGFSYYQATRETQIQKLDEHFPKTFEAYRKAKGRLPETIVIYRIGASEGEYSRLVTEIDEIRKSFASVGGSYNPKLVVILAQRHSHVRVFPAEIKGRRSSEQNVTSGTAIDNVENSNGFDEFILVSQAPLIGTSRPTRYTVVCNTANWSKNEILNVTYMLAFGHQVSYQPPSVPDVLYAAENLAKRGHNNYKTYTRIESMQGTVENLIRRKQLGTSKEEETQLLDMIIDEVSDSINKMTIKGRNFWA